MKQTRISGKILNFRTLFTTFMFIIITFLTTIGTIITLQTSLTSNAIKQATSNITANSFFYLMATENSYFTYAADSHPSFSKLAMKLITNIDVEDPRSFLQNTLPGFSLFDGTIVVAGEGSDFTNMPIESAPPLDVIMTEREAASDRLEVFDGSENKVPESADKNVFHIIHSHSRESFLPELKSVSNPDEAWHTDRNITLVGERIGKKLQERGIGAEVDKTDITSLLYENDLNYSESYEVSRDIVKSAMENDQNLEYFLEIHRDSQRRDTTTVTINGTAYARLYFVIGKNNPNYEKNLEIAENIHHLIEHSYPGLSRGVLVKNGTGINGRYNQDLSEKSLLVELGGVDNTLEEVFRTSDVLVDVLSEYYSSSTDGE